MLIVNSAFLLVENSEQGFVKNKMGSKSQIQVSTKKQSAKRKSSSLYIAVNVILKESVCGFYIWEKAREILTWVFLQSLPVLKSKQE